ncbi:MAG: hypothetical protein JF564_01330, partial [Sphingomonas sp.]|nr:hypothetical protein [Sphingomonas sp.]
MIAAKTSAAVMAARFKVTRQTSWNFRQRMAAAETDHGYQRRVDGHSFDRRNLALRNPGRGDKLGLAEPGGDPSGLLLRASEGYKS